MSDGTSTDMDQLKLLMTYSRAHLGEAIDWKAMAGHSSGLTLRVIDKPGTRGQSSRRAPAPHQRPSPASPTAGTTSN